MSTSILARRWRVCLPLTAVALCLAAGTSTALAASDSRPFVGTFYEQDPVSFTITDVPCFGSQTGELTGTETFSVHYNNNPDFFHMAGTDTLDARVDFPDGTYLVGSTTARIEESADAQAAYLKDTRIEFGDATAYAADGSELGLVRWQATSHATWQDLNGNHELDPGEVQGGIDRLRILSCP